MTRRKTANPLSQRGDRVRQSPAGPVLTERDLRAGDILLSLGVGELSTAIKELDGGRYSHAALWTGATVIESTLPVVVEHELAASLRAHPREYVDVYRHKAVGSSAERVLEKARSFRQRRYSSGDLLLVTLLMATTSFRPTPKQATTLRVGSAISDFLGLDREKPGELVTCTELVVRSFAAAGLSIHIFPRGGGRFDSKAIAKALWALADGAKRGARGSPPNGSLEAEDWEQFQQALRTKYEELTGYRLDRAVRRWDGKSRVAASEYGAGLVTPRFLADSTDLSRQGHLDLSRIAPSDVRAKPLDPSEKGGAPNSLALVTGAEQVELPTLVVQTTYFSPSEKPVATELGELLYDLLTRSRLDPLSFGPGIPVSVAARHDRVDMNAARHVLLLPVLGQESFDDESTRDEVLSTVARWRGTAAAAQSNVVPIFLASAWRAEETQLPTPLLDKLRKDMDGRWDSILRSVVLAACKLLSDGRRPTIFISHAKRDADYTKGLASDLATFVKTNTVGADAFFDVNDVTPGSDLTEQLGRAAANGVLVAVRGDAYGRQPWCELELLAAKRAQMPTLTVDILAEGEPRSLPYGGNGPVVVHRPGQNIAPLILRAFVEWLGAAHFKMETQRVASELPDPIILPRPPELLDLAQGPLLNQEPTIVLHPDPEVSATERGVLQAARPRMRLVTPTTVYRSPLRRGGVQPRGAPPAVQARTADGDGAPLFGRTIALAVSNTPEAESGESGFTKHHVDDAIAFVSRSLISAGAALAYGGDFRPGGFDELLSRLIVAYNRSGTSKVKYLYSYVTAARPRPTPGETSEFLRSVCHLGSTSPYKEQAVLSPATQAPSPGRAALYVSDMRRVMTKNTFARVVLGGQSWPQKNGENTGYVGPYPGVLEEAWRSLEDRQPLYIAGGFGGAASLAARLLDGGSVPEAMEEQTFAEGPWFAEFRDRASEFARDPDCKKLGVPTGMKPMAEALVKFGRRRLGTVETSLAWNGLTLAENRALFHTRDPVAIAALITKGLFACARRASAGKARIKLVRGSIVQAERVDALAIATFRDIPIAGAGGVVDQVLSSRLTMARQRGEKLVAIPSNAIDADWLIVEDLGSSRDMKALASTVERCARDVGALAARHGFRAIATITFGGSLLQNVDEVVERMIAGFKEAATGTTLQWFEIDRQRFEKLKVALEKRDDVQLEVQELPPVGTPVATARERDLFVAVRYADETIHSTVVAPGGAAAALSSSRKLTKAQLRDLVKPDANQVPSSDELAEIGDRVAQIVFGAEGVKKLRQFPDARIVIAHDAESSAIPFETLRTGDTRYALEKGIVRRPLFAEDGLLDVPIRPQRVAPLGVLVIANPTEDLPGTEVEAKAVIDAIANMTNVKLHKVLWRREATKASVLNWLQDTSIDIIHYSGHAYFAGPTSEGSGIVCAGQQPLLVEDLAHVQISPSIAFVNGCQSARVRKRKVRDLSLAFAEYFLRSGVEAYLGTFWPVGDTAAAKFATTVYRELGSGRSLDIAVKNGRAALFGGGGKGSVPDWADYVLYGDGDFRVVTPD